MAIGYRAASLVATVFGGLMAGALGPRAASAQGFSNFNGAPTGPVVGTADDKSNAPHAAAPPALPGSRVQKTEPAPAQQGAGDLPPTEALFDAVNRGDMASARDAVNRGAEISARNVLGLTPLDLSIDLGRNEITFLLLSLRPASPGDAPTSAKPGTSVARAKNPEPSRRVEHVARAASASRAPAAEPAVAPLPRQYAGQRQDPGTPIPQMGFLGFGSVTR